MKESNFRHTLIVCPECKHDEILIDDFHQETYCTRCGLILSENNIIRITEEIRKAHEKEMFIRSLWHRKKM